MSKEGFKLNPIYLKEIDFEALIISIPDEDIEDRLTFFARDNGDITKVIYEDFLITNFTANIHQLLAKVNKLSDVLEDMSGIRTILLVAIIDANPKLSPDKLIINKNNVLKLRPSKLAEGDRVLSETAIWTIMDDKGHTDLPKEPVDAPVVKSPQKPKKSTRSTKRVEDINFTTKDMWWKRIGRYVTIKQFPKEEAETILAKRFFHNRASFQTYIVSICVVDFEELFAFLDNMGIPGRVTPSILINELYKLCLKCNEVLTFEKAQEFTEESLEDEDGAEEGSRKTASGGSMSQYVKKKPKRKFRDVTKESLLTLSERMKIFLVGQGQAVDDLVEAIQRASVGLKDPARPIGSFLFAGRTGVGKTLATKILANELIKDKDNLLTVDCSEYSADHEYSKLIGAPSGYVGYEAGGVLTNFMQKNPFSVVVFDEVEKASHKVHELMLQILEEGRLTDGKGKEVSFSDAIVIMTSNIGVAEIDSIKKTVGFGDVAKLTDEKKNSALDEALKKKFKPEFLNRLDAIVHFRTLNKQDYMRIIDLELYKLNDNLKSNDTDYKEIEIKFAKSVKDYIYGKGIDEEYGARPLKRCIEKEISTPLARKLLSDETNLKSVVSVGVSKGKISFRIEIPEIEDDEEETKVMKAGK